MGISKRLKFISELVTRGNTVADIGCDHGFVPVYLVSQNISPYVFAVDISPDSLNKAVILAQRSGFSDRIECRLSDGFAKLKPFEADTAIIAGMGGILMCSMIEAEPETFGSLKEVIVSPHRDQELVRTVLCDHGFLLTLDECIEDKNKKYTVIKAVNKKFL